VKKIVASDWSVEKLKKIKIVFTVFPTDQSEAELLYLYSLFFSVKKPFTKRSDYLFNETKGKPFSHELYFRSGSKRWIITSAGGGVGARVMRHLFDSRENK
jgi:hypothetical protein